MVRSKQLVSTGVVVVSLSVALLLLFTGDSTTRLLSTQGFEPYGQCFLWLPDLTRLFVISDSLIALSWFAIFSGLTYLGFKVTRGHVFNSVFVPATAFVLLAGTVHLLEVWTLWTPAYWLAGYTRGITAIAGVAAVLLLIPAGPKLARFLETGTSAEEHKQKLVMANRELEAEIAERRRVEMELREALEREQHLNQFRANFVSRMSHEFRTPLAIAMTASDLLKSYGHKMSEEQKLDRVAKIQVEIRNMTDLLEDILTVHRIEAGTQDFRPEPVNLEGLCREALEDAEKKALPTHQLVFTPSGNCSIAMLDRRLFLQLLTNVLENAIKFSPKGGEVKLELQCTADEAIIRVRDQGMGISEADKAYLFEAFHRGRNAESTSGTGLGLAISRYVASFHGGTIGIDSEEGHGTTVIVRVPLRPEHWVDNPT